MVGSSPMKSRPSRVRGDNIVALVVALHLQRVAINQRSESTVGRSDSRSKHISEQGHDRSRTSSGSSELVGRAESYCIFSNVGGREITTEPQRNRLGTVQLLVHCGIVVPARVR